MFLRKTVSYTIQSTPKYSCEPLHISYKHHMNPHMITKQRYPVLKGSILLILASLTKKFLKCENGEKKGLTRLWLRDAEVEWKQFLRDMTALHIKTRAAKRNSLDSSTNIYNIHQLSSIIYSQDCVKQVKRRGWHVCDWEMQNANETNSFDIWLHYI